jgi:hypothetical protein
MLINGGDIEVIVAFRLEGACKISHLKNHKAAVTDLKIFRATGRPQSGRSDPRFNG